MTATVCHYEHKLPANGQNSAHGRTGCMVGCGALLWRLSRGRERDKGAPNYPSCHSMTQMKASEAASIALNAKVDLLITRISAVEESINMLGRRATNTDNSLGVLCQMADAYGDSAISPMDCCHEEYDDGAHGTDQDGNKVVCMARTIASVMFGNVGVGTCASTCGGF